MLARWKRRSGSLSGWRRCTGGRPRRKAGGWLLRAGDGFTGRANSALAVGDPGVPLDDALAAVCDWYHARGLPAMLAVPMRIPGPTASPSALDDQLAERAWSLRAARLSS